MFFFFRKKQRVFDVFTDNAMAYHGAPLQRADKLYPDWWKKLPLTYKPDHLNELPTARSCAGIIDMYRNSYILPMWSDLNIEIGATPEDGYRYQYSNQQSELTHHELWQYDDAFDCTRTQHIKLNCAWVGSCSIPTRMLWTNPVYNRSELFDVNILPGVIDHNKIATQFNINMLLKRYKDAPTVYRFKFGEPMVMMTPLIEDKLVIKNHLVSPSEFRRISSSYNTITFTNAFRVMRKYQNDQQATKKCPFGF